MTRERVLLQCVLNQHREPIYALAHVGVAQSQMHFHAGRNDHHRVVSRSATCRRTTSGSLPSGANTRRPSGRSIAVMPLGNGSRCKASAAGWGFVLSVDCSLDSTTGASSAFAFRPYPNSARQRNKALVASLRARATAETLFPGCSHSSTMASFSSLVKLRRLTRPSRAESAAVASVKSRSTTDSLAALLALSAYLRAGTRMKLCSPINFDLATVDQISPAARERHPAPVQRLHMHCPERLHSLVAFVRRQLERSSPALPPTLVVLGFRQGF